MLSLLLAMAHLDATAFFGHEEYPMRVHVMVKDGFVTIRRKDK